ncbi:MAG: hypothetical protein AAF916_11455, partial [Planctomycetota bacterium]
SLDLSQLWSADPNRVNGVAGSPPLVQSDISDRAIGLWFFDAPGAITFGSLDASDTITYTDGALTSIDIEVTADFSVSTTTWSGLFTISGADLSFQINDSQPFGFGSSDLVVDLTGTVLAVPEPAAGCPPRRSRDWDPPTRAAKDQGCPRQRFPRRYP